MVESGPSSRSDVKSMVYATDRFDELLPSGNFSFCREAMDEASANVPHSGRLGLDEGRRVTRTPAAAMTVLPTKSRADQGRLVRRETCRGGTGPTGAWRGHD